MRTTKWGIISTIGLVATMTISGCGGDDDVTSGTASDPADDTAADSDDQNAGDDQGVGDPGSGDSQGDDDPGSGDSQSPDATGEASAGDPDEATPLPTPDELDDVVPPPNTDEMAPADGPPEPGSVLFLAMATATAGDGTEEFSGFDGLWFTESSPAGQPLWDVLDEVDGRDDYDHRPSDFDHYYVAGCSVIQTADGLTIAQASFHRRTARNEHSYFSMSDNGDGTVVWGLYDADSGQEWSATGEGSATVSYLTHEDDPGDDGGHVFDSIRPELGLGPRSDDVFIVIEFSGEASENFTTDKSQASSRVVCQYARAAD